MTLEEKESGAADRIDDPEEVHSCRIKQQPRQEPRRREIQAPIFNKKGAV